MRDGGATAPERCRAEATLKSVALEATGWPESPPTAMKIVKERGGSRQNTLRRVRRAFSETWIFFALVGYGAVATVVGPFP